MMTDRSKTVLSIRDLSNQRNGIYGIAIVLICIFHLNNVLSEGVQIVSFISRTASFFFDMFNIGVDIFLFMSGFGLFYSMRKDTHAVSFYTKRLLRIIPAYWTGLILFYTVTYICTSAVDVKTLIMKLFMIDFYVSGDQFLWYPVFIIVLYALFPLYFKHADTLNKKRIVFAAVLILCIASHFLPGMEHSRFDMAKDRIPVFILGTIIAQKGFEDQKSVLVRGLTPKHILAAGIMILVFLDVLILYIENYYLKPYDFLYLIYLPLSCLLLIVFTLILKAGRIRTVKTVIGKAGGLSYEIYIGHESLLAVMKQYMSIENKAVFVLVFLIFTLIVTVMLAGITKIVKNRKNLLAKQKKADKLY